MQKISCSQCGGVIEQNAHSGKMRCRYCDTLYSVFQDILSPTLSTHSPADDKPTYAFIPLEWLTGAEYSQLDCETNSLNKSPEYKEICESLSESFFTRSRYFRRRVSYDYDIGKINVPATLDWFLFEDFASSVNKLEQKRMEIQEKASLAKSSKKAKYYYGKMHEFENKHKEKYEMKNYTFPETYPTALLVRKEGDYWRDVFFSYIIGNITSRNVSSYDFVYTSIDKNVYADKVKRIFAKCNFHETATKLSEYLNYCTSEFQRAEKLHNVKRAQLVNTIEHFMSSMKKS